MAGDLCLESLYHRVRPAKLGKHLVVILSTVERNQAGAFNIRSFFLQLQQLQDRRQYINRDTISEILRPRGSKFRT